MVVLVLVISTCSDSGRYRINLMPAPAVFENGEINPLPKGLPPVSYDDYRMLYATDRKPSDDPLYGQDPPGEKDILFLGQMAIQGERNLLKIPYSFLVRLRYNPFYAFLEKRVLEWFDKASNGSTALWGGKSEMKNPEGIALESGRRAAGL